MVGFDLRYVLLFKLYFIIALKYCRKLVEISVCLPKNLRVININSYDFGVLDKVIDVIALSTINKSRHCRHTYLIIPKSDICSIDFHIFISFSVVTLAGSFKMCGIFAYLNYLTPKTRKEIVTLLINGLKRLEYRGYDSAGKYECILTKFFS